MYKLLVIILLFSNIVYAKPVSLTIKDISIAGISRNQDNKARIPLEFTFTSRPCPPFCIQPINPFKPARVDAVTELDIIEVVKKIKEEEAEDILIVDNRIPFFLIARKGGTIPTAINIPYYKLNNYAVKKDIKAVKKILVEYFGVTIDEDGKLNFEDAKILYLFCGGIWSAQTTTVIKTLLKLGYIDRRLKYYRGGMNSWHFLGLTTVDENGKDILGGTGQIQ